MCTGIPLFKVVEKTTIEGLVGPGTLQALSVTKVVIRTLARALELDLGHRTDIDEAELRQRLGSMALWPMIRN